MSRATDYLRQLGLPDEQITAMQAELDQATAEADHLIDHALRLNRGSIAEAAVQGLVIRGHIDALTIEAKHNLLSVVIVRAGQLANAVETLNREKKRLEAALAAEQGATA